ncbi:TPA: hypothetical protein SMR47_000159 [Pseudomonas putida]|nr:hypothetical protein [Pseudomonas putida]
MNLRTFTVINRDNAQLNGVLVCAFQATAINRTFLAYTLNEHLDNQLIRIYLAPLDIEPQAVFVTTASSDEFRVATQAFKALLEDLGSNNEKSQHVSYQRVELGEQELPSTRLEGHHQIRGSHRWLLKLLSADIGTSDEQTEVPLVDAFPTDEQLVRSFLSGGG